MRINIAAMCDKVQHCQINILALHQSEVAVGRQWSFFEDSCLISASGNFSGFNKRETKQQICDSSMQNCNKELIANISFGVNGH